jgi:hypothetical protein
MHRSAAVRAPARARPATELAAAVRGSAGAPRAPAAARGRPCRRRSRSGASRRPAAAAGSCQPRARARPPARRRSGAPWARRWCGPCTCARPPRWPPRRSARPLGPSRPGRQVAAAGLGAGPGATPAAQHARGARPSSAGAWGPLSTSISQRRASGRSRSASAASCAGRPGGGAGSRRHGGAREARLAEAKLAETATVSGGCRGWLEAHMMCTSPRSTGSTTAVTSASDGNPPCAGRAH